MLRFWESQEKRDRRIFDAVLRDAFKKLKDTGYWSGFLAGCAVGGSIVAEAVARGNADLRSRWGRGNHELARAWTRLFSFAVLSRLLLLVEARNGPLTPAVRDSTLDTAADYLDQMFGRDDRFSKDVFRNVDIQFRADLSVLPPAFSFYELTIYAETALSMASFETGLDLRVATFPICKLSSITTPTRQHAATVGDIVFLSTVLTEAVRVAEGHIETK